MVCLLERGDRESNFRARVVCRCQLQPWIAVCPELGGCRSFRTIYAISNNGLKESVFALLENDMSGFLDVPLGKRNRNAGRYQCARALLGC
jgi:hypothetical protein